jgi:hypothetical protein
MKKNNIDSFEFMECIAILKTTGKKADSMKSLRDIIAIISDESIFHHTYQYFLKGHIMEHTNDFANWVAMHLEERVLAERLSNIDPYIFKTIEDIRKELLRILDEYIKDFPESRHVHKGDEFYFTETVTMVFPLGLKAKSLAEFLVAIKNIETSCIYYHFYDARIRHGRGIDDFSRWIEKALGEIKLAKKIRMIDPFMHSLEGIRSHITDLVEQHVRAEMQGIET